MTDTEVWISHCNDQHPALQQPERSDPAFLYKLLQAHSLDHQEERVTDHEHRGRRVTGPDYSNEPGTPPGSGRRVR